MEKTPFDDDFLVENGSGDFFVTPGEVCKLLNSMLAYQSAKIIQNSIFLELPFASLELCSRDIITWDEHSASDSLGMIFTFNQLLVSHKQMIRLAQELTCKLVEQSEELIRATLEEGKKGSLLMNVTLDINERVGQELHFHIHHIVGLARFIYKRAQLY